MSAKINYGIYVDHKHAFIVSLNHLQHEQFIEENILDNTEHVVLAKHVNEQEHVQNRAHEYLAKMCKSVASKLTNPHSIVIFGPAGSKYTMMHTIENSPEFKNTPVEIEATDVMDKAAAIRFVKGHFSTITVGQQTFTAAKK